MFRWTILTVLILTVGEEWSEKSLPHGGRLSLVTGRSSAWLERSVRDRKVGGSNPLAPTSEGDIRHRTNVPFFNSEHFPESAVTGQPPTDGVFAAGAHS